MTPPLFRQFTKLFGRDAEIGGDVIAAREREHPGLLFQQVFVTFPRGHGLPHLETFVDFLFVLHPYPLVLSRGFGVLPQGAKDVAMGEGNGGHGVQSFQAGIQGMTRNDIFLGAEEKAYDLSCACLDVFDHMSFFQEDTAGRIGIG